MIHSVSRLLSLIMSRANFQYGYRVLETMNALKSHVLIITFGFLTHQKVSRKNRNLKNSDCKPKKNAR